VLFNVAIAERDARHYAVALAALREMRREGVGRLSPAEDKQIAGAIDAFLPLTAPVELSSDPPGAEVFVDGILVGKTPLAPDARLDLGPRTIVVKREGFKDATVPLDVRGAVARVVVLEPVKRRGELRIVSDPPGAAVRIDDAERGTTPLTITLEEGPHRVSVTQEGFLASTVTENVAPNTPREIAAKLVRDEATLRVEAAKSGDAVVLDGKPIGRGTVRTRTTSGSHRIEIFDGGTQVYTTELTLRPGEERGLAAPSRGLSWGWYAGGAAALVGGATLGYLLLREDTPGRVGSPGTLNPQRIDVPSRLGGVGGGARGRARVRASPTTNVAALRAPVPRKRPRTRASLGSQWPSFQNRVSCRRPTRR
jgi:hypothetical protein